MAETDHILNKALRRLCEERLLPNLVTSMSQQLSANTKLDYKRKVLSKYRYCAPYSENNCAFLATTTPKRERPNDSCSSRRCTE